MTGILPRAIGTALLLIGIVSPGFAQSSYHSYSAGIQHARQHNAAIRQNGFNSFALVPSIGSSSAPALTGGGSVGYNANVLKDE